jgi:hypothetical protein
MVKTITPANGSVPTHYTERGGADGQRSGTRIERQLNTHHPADFEQGGNALVDCFHLIFQGNSDECPLTSDVTTSKTAKSPIVKYGRVTQGVLI